MYEAQDGIAWLRMIKVADWFQTEEHTQIPFCSHKQFRVQTLLLVLENLLNLMYVHFICKYVSYKNSNFIRASTCISHRDALCSSVKAHVEQYRKYITVKIMHLNISKDSLIGDRFLFMRGIYVYFVCAIQCILIKLFQLFVVDLVLLDYFLL